jgi:oxygen-independent coproporphyrinogen-3 oxidase
MSLAVDVPHSAYVHVPFCRRRCFYCDFPVSIVGDRPPLSRQTNAAQRYATIDEYLDYLLQEIRITPQIASTNGPLLRTVFFGGGTPSLLSASQVERILETLSDRFGIADTAEISIEMDPGTFDQDRINGYRAAGVNRVSLGVQAFQSHLLTACGRTHTPEDISIAFDLLRQADIKNISLDLISGLPHQTLLDWQDSLSQAIALQPTHLSVYDLTIEPMTAFSHWYKPGISPLPSDEVTANMYRIAQQMLTQAGYQHYEISNYAKPQYQCRHNKAYWTNSAYYGFGMGAASYTQEQRFSRPRTRRDYYAWVRSLVTNSGQIDYPITTTNEKLLDTLMLGLRLAEGISLAQLADDFGQPVINQLLQCLAPYLKRQWVMLVDEKGRSQLFPFQYELHVYEPSLRIRLSDPEGFLFSNVVLSDVFKTFDSDH